MTINSFARGGPQVLGDGDVSGLRISKSSELVVSQLHENWFEQSRRNNVFIGTQTAGLVLRAVNTVTPTFGLLNPINSSSYLSLIRWKLVVTTSPVTPVIGPYVLAGNMNPITAPPIPAVSAATPLINSGKVGGTQPSPQGIISVVLALTVNPSIYAPFVSHLTGAPTTLPNMDVFQRDFRGTCLLAPGCSMGAYQLTAEGTDAFAVQTIIWEEIPI